MAKHDIYQDITNNIIELISAGQTHNTALWTHADVDLFGAHNAVTKSSYTGVNRFTLALKMIDMGYSENKWVTYKQAEKAGWQVRRGEKSVKLCFYSKYDKKNKDTGEEEEVYFLKGFNVFNVAQLEGYEPEEAKITATKTTPIDNPMIAAILKHTDVKMLPEQGNSAYYSPSCDAIQMPPRERFTSESAYQNVIIHELQHSTSHKSRLGRGETYRKLYKSQREIYAREELVAELGAAFLCSEIGCLQETIEHHASYIDSWLSLLKSDKRAIFKACADAQKSSDFIMNNWCIMEEDEQEQTAA